MHLSVPRLRDPTGVRMLERAGARRRPGLLLEMRTMERERRERRTFYECDSRCATSTGPDGGWDCHVVLAMDGRVSPDVESKPWPQAVGGTELPGRMHQTVASVDFPPKVVRHGCTSAIIQFNDATPRRESLNCVRESGVSRSEIAAADRPGARSSDRYACDGGCGFRSVAGRPVGRGLPDGRGGLGHGGVSLRRHGRAPRTPPTRLPRGLRLLRQSCPRRTGGHPGPRSKRSARGCLVRPYAVFGGGAGRCGLFLPRRSPSPPRPRRVYFSRTWRSPQWLPCGLRGHLRGAST